jgi:N-dimethylarginine dimethylaminohydrolase
MTFLRLSEQNHQLSLMAEALTCQSKVNRPADIEVVEETPLFLDGVFAELMNELAVAAAEVLDSDMLPEEEEESDLEDDDAFVVQSISFDEQDHGHVMQAFDGQTNAVAIQNETIGIYEIECNLIDDFTNRSLWDEEKNALCKCQ